MSLPPATSDISDHPAKNAVTDPVNVTHLHEDLDRKLRLYVVLQALRAGKLPDNTQIDEVLQYMANHSPVDINALSSDGSELVKDIREIIDTAREIVKQKNADEVFQNFVWHTRGVDLSPAKKGTHETVNVTVDKAKADSQQAAHHLRTLLSLLITNTEARKMLSDFSVIGRDLLARSANILRPDEETLRRVDEPVSSTEPAFVKRDENAPHAVKGKVQEKKRQAAGEGTSALKDTRREAEGTHAEIQATDDSKVKREKAREGTKARVSELRERVPSQYRERVNAQFDRARHFLSDEYFPKERRDRFISRVKKIVVECQEDKSYQESIKWFLDVLPQYGRGGGPAVTKDRVWWKQGEFQLAMDELILLLTRFANGTSPQTVTDTFKRIMQLAKEDEEMSQWLGHVQDWIRKILLEPGYVVDAQSSKDGTALREEGRKFYDEKYKSYFDNFFDAVSTWFTALTTDPLNMRFGEDWARLTRHLLFNAEGKLTWKPELWADIRQVIIPQIIDKLGYIPIPRAEFSDQNLDLVIEDLTLSGRNLFPNIVSIEAHNYAKFSPYTSIHDDSNHTFVITLGQIQADLRDVMFYFKKKTGIAKLRDSGIADILLGGSGITTTIRLQNAPRESGSLFFVRSVHVKVDALKFRIRDSQHDALYKFLRPIAVVIVKREVQRALTKSIKTVFETIDHLLVKVRDRMDEAKLREGETRAGALKDFITKQTQEMREKKRHEGPGHFNLSPKRGSLLLPNIGNPKSWFHRQQEEEKTVAEGREWRSKAFNILPPASEAPAGSHLMGGAVPSAFGGGSGVPRKG